MLHPWVTFAIMPIFAFANAGVSFAGASLADLVAPLPLGIAAGALRRQADRRLRSELGSPSGSGSAACRMASRWTALYGVSLLSGIGFTMSLFIGSLAFEDPAHAVGVRLGVFLGSILSGLCGYLLLRAVGGRQCCP